MTRRLHLRGLFSVLATATLTLLLGLPLNAPEQLAVSNEQTSNSLSGIVSENIDSLERIIGVATL